MAQSKSKVKLIDFTGTVDGFEHHERFGPRFISLVRGGDCPETLVVIDRAMGLDEPCAQVVDHLNLTGTNPLIGPNDPCGDRFPVVQGVYVACAFGIPQVVAAGVKPGLAISEEDLRTVREFGADCCCANLVPAMIAAAHARKKLLGILLSEGATVSAEVLDQVEKLAGEG